MSTHRVEFLSCPFYPVWEQGGASNDLVHSHSCGVRPGFHQRSQDVKELVAGEFGLGSRVEQFGCEAGLVRALPPALIKLVELAAINPGQSLALLPLTTGAINH